MFLVLVLVRFDNLSKCQSLATENKFQILYLFDIGKNAKFGTPTRTSLQFLGALPMTMGFALISRWGHSPNSPKIYTPVPTYSPKRIGCVDKTLELNREFLNGLTEGDTIVLPAAPETISRWLTGVNRTHFIRQTQTRETTTTTILLSAGETSFRWWITGYVWVGCSMYGVVLRRFVG